jgi:hypothetical protein
MAIRRRQPGSGQLRFKPVFNKLTARIPLQDA